MTDVKDKEIYSDQTLFEKRPIIKSDEIVTLYHGSKEGIRGTISPISRERCDFGKGFYMGTDRTQPFTLICNFPKAVFYTLSVDLSGLEILNIEVFAGTTDATKNRK